jgi:hypothetical protein
LFRKIQIIRAEMCCGFFFLPITQTFASLLWVLPPPPHASPRFLGEYRQLSLLRARNSRRELESEWETGLRERERNSGAWGAILEVSTDKPLNLGWEEQLAGFLVEQDNLQNPEGR